MKVKPLSQVIIHYSKLLLNIFVVLNKENELSLLEDKKNVKFEGI